MTEAEFKSLLADLVANAALDNEDGREDYSPETQELFDRVVTEWKVRAE